MQEVGLLTPSLVQLHMDALDKQVLQRRVLGVYPDDALGERRYRVDRLAGIQNLALNPDKRHL